MAACRLSLSQKLHHFMSHSQLCVSKVCNLRFPKNSQRIPKEFSKNSQKSQIRTLQPYIPKKYPKNSQKIPKEFPKNSKIITRKFQKNFQSIPKTFPNRSPKILKKFSLALIGGNPF